MAKHVRGMQFLITLLLLIGLTLPAWSQEAAPKQSEGPHGSVLAAKLGPDDWFLPVTSVEWGAPDRWSLTARYVHLFDKDRDHKPRLDNLTVILSPGTDGGRFGIGYQGIFAFKDHKDLALFLEPRAVLLRTWGNPLETKPNRTFVGAEMRGALSFICNIGVGWYRQISSHEGRPDSFWGIHIGFGI